MRRNSVTDACSSPSTIFAASSIVPPERRVAGHSSRGARGALTPGKLSLRRRYRLNLFPQVPQNPLLLKRILLTLG